MLYFLRVIFLVIIEIIKQVVNKIKFDYKIEYIFGVILGMYFLVITIHYFGFQNEIDILSLKESKLNTELFSLQEKNNLQANTQDKDLANSTKNYQSDNNAFLMLLDNILTNQKEFFVYNRILKKNNKVFINLQTTNKDQNLLHEVKKLFNNFDYAVTKIRDLQNIIKIYITVAL